MPFAHDHLTSGQGRRFTVFADMLTVTSDEVRRQISPGLKPFYNNYSYFVEESRMPERMATTNTHVSAG